jgi:LemA protein
LLCSDARSRRARSRWNSSDMTKKLWIILAVLAAVVVLPVGCSVSTYNSLVRADQSVQSSWAQVENVYQRRLDLVPNLVETVKGAAAFEKETFIAVTEARSRAAAVSAASAGAAPKDPEQLQKFQNAQAELGSALSRLMVVVERYPDLKATQNFRDLQAQLEGTENRIAVERMRFNEATRDFNARAASFPTVLVASLFGGRFREKGYFRADPGAAKAPSVKF